MPSRPRRELTWLRNIALRLISREYVFEITQVKQVDDLFCIEIQKQLPQGHAATLGPQIETSVGKRGEGQVNHAFMRTQPAKLRMLRKFLRDCPEIRHEVFKFLANEFFAQPFNRFANQFVPQAERKHDAGAEDFFVGGQQGGGKCVLGARVYRVAACAFLQREAHVACLQ